MSWSMAHSREEVEIKYKKSKEYLRLVDCRYSPLAANYLVLSFMEDDQRQLF